MKSSLLQAVKDTNEKAGLPKGGLRSRGSFEDSKSRRKKRGGPKGQLITLDGKSRESSVQSGRG